MVLALDIAHWSMLLGRFTIWLRGRQQDFVRGSYSQEVTEQSDLCHLGGGKDDSVNYPLIRVISQSPASDSSQQV